VGSAGVIPGRPKGEPGTQNRRPGGLIRNGLHQVARAPVLDSGLFAARSPGM